MILILIVPPWIVDRVKFLEKQTGTVSLPPSIVLVSPATGDPGHAIGHLNVAFIRTVGCNCSGGEIIAGPELDFMTVFNL